MSVINWNPAEIMKLSASTWTMCALEAAVNLDVFSALDAEKEPSAAVPELARRLGCEPRALNMLVTALVAMGLLTRDGEKVGLTEAGRRWFSTGSDEYQGFTVKHMSHILPAWARLDQAVKKGGAVCEQSPPDTDDEDGRESFLMAMFNVARGQADRVVDALDLAGRRRLLDLGGGPGTYALAFCRRHPGLRATVFDMPTTERFAKATAERFGLTDRVDFVGGDFLESELPDGFDAVWLSQVLHGETPEDAARLVSRAAAALAPGGLLAIQEFVLDDDLRGPLPSALFSLNMLVMTPGGQSYTESEIKAMMAAAGLSNIRRLAADLPGGCGIIVADKG